MFVDTDYIFKYSRRNTIFMGKYLLIFIQVCIFVDELKTKISNYGNFI